MFVTMPTGLHRAAHSRHPVCQTRVVLEASCQVQLSRRLAKDPS